MSLLPSPGSDGTGQSVGLGRTGAWPLGWQRAEHGVEPDPQVGSPSLSLVPYSPCPPPTAAATGTVWPPGPPTCASVPRATAGPCVTAETTPPAPARPSGVTTGSATSPSKGSPTACASLASAGSAAAKVGLVSLRGRPRACPPLTFRVLLPRCHVPAFPVPSSSIVLSLSLRCLRPLFPLPWFTALLPSALTPLPSHCCSPPASLAPIPAYPLHSRLPPPHSTSHLSRLHWHLPSSLIFPPASPLHPTSPSPLYSPPPPPCFLSPHLPASCACLPSPFLPTPPHPSLLFPLPSPLSSPF